MSPPARRGPGDHRRPGGGAGGLRVVARSQVLAQLLGRLGSGDLHSCDNFDDRAYLR